MKGKIVFVIKKWWVLALVLTLALSLTSCSKKRTNLLGTNSFGFGYCDGALGSFDIYTIPKANGFDVDLVVIPYQATNGDIIQIGIVNSGSFGFKVTTYQSVVQLDAEISSTITMSDLANFDVLAIRPFTAGGFLDGNVAADAICALPLPPGFGGGALGTGF